MSTTTAANDPTMAANATTTKTQGKEKVILANEDIEFLLRDIEEKWLDPFSMRPKIQLWDKNDFYGEAGGGRREAFSRFLNNKIRRKGYGWKEYVNLLDEREIDMSENTEKKYEEEVEANGGPNDDAVMDNTRAVAFAVLDSVNEKKSTLNFPVVPTKISDPMDDLANQFRNATTLAVGGTPTQATQVPTNSPFGSPFCTQTSPFHSPAIQQRLSFDEAQPPSTQHILADYAPDGTRERPTSVYFNESRPSHHMGLFIHQDDIPSGHQEIKTTIVQKSGAIGDINNVYLEVAHSVPSCFQPYIGRALLFREATNDCFGRNISAFVNKSATDPAKHKTATKLKKAQVANSKGKNAWTFKLILFPPTQEPFDNRVFSNDDLRVNRESIPNDSIEPMTQKELNGFTSTWKIAHAGQMEDIEMRDDNLVDLTTFY